MQQEQWPSGIETSQHEDVIISELAADPEYRAAYEDLIVMHRNNGNDQHASRMEALVAAADARERVPPRAAARRFGQQQDVLRPKRLPGSGRA